MRKRIALIFLSLLLLLGLVACNKEENQDEPVQANEATVEEAKKETILVEPSDNIDLTGLAKVDTFNVNVESNSDLIEVYIDSQLDELGNLILDDGQAWKIIASVGGKDYVLFDDYVQLGKVNIYTRINDDNSETIITEYSTTAGLIVDEFNYSQEKEHFEKTNLFNLEGNINKLSNY